jgi:hypothetical protein
MIALAVNQGAFREEFQRVLGRAQNPTAVLMGAGRALGNLLKNHFRKKDREEPNKLSPRREHFWLQVSRTVSAPAQSGYNSVAVKVSDPRIAQKVYGGTITAKAAGALTIPVEERAYGRTASTFEAETGLKLILIRTGGGKNNAFQNAVLAVKEGGGLVVEYLLTKSVDQAADPTALPSMAQMQAAVLARAQKIADRQEGDANGK